MKKSVSLKNGECAWEVMEQSVKYGEVPVRLALGKDGIRTLTSLALVKPATEVKELWKVNSVNILKFSWCEELCVISVLYRGGGGGGGGHIDEASPQTETKVFFVDVWVGKKMMSYYKKVKPASVVLSPEKKQKSKSQQSFLSITNEEEKFANISSSFVLKEPLDKEKAWRAMDVRDGTVTEVFFGLSPTGLRLIVPSNSEVDLFVNKIHLMSITYGMMYGYNMLKVKYLEETNAERGKCKPSKRLFYVLPLTAKEIISYYETTCTSEFAEEADDVSKLPKLSKSFSDKISSMSSTAASIETKTTALEQQNSNAKRTRSKSRGAEPKKTSEGTLLRSSSSTYVGTVKKTNSQEGASSNLANSKERKKSENSTDKENKEKQSTDQRKKPSRSISFKDLSTMSKENIPRDENNTRNHKYLSTVDEDKLFIPIVPQQEKSSSKEKESSSFAPFGRKNTNIKC